MVIAISFSYNWRTYLKPNWSCSDFIIITKRFIGQMMGVWFLASSLGAILAGLISGQATNNGLSSMPDLFNQIAIISTIFGLVLILISKPLQNWVFKKDHS